MAAVSSATLQPDVNDFQQFKITQVGRKRVVRKHDVRWSRADYRQFIKGDAFARACKNRDPNTGRFDNLSQTIFCDDQTIWNNPNHYEHYILSRFNINAKETTFNLVNQQLKLWDNPHYLQDPDFQNMYYLSNMDKLFLWPYENMVTWVTEVTKDFKEHKIKRFRRQPAIGSQYQVTYRLPHQLHESRNASAPNAQSMIIPSYGELETPEYLQSGLSPDGDPDCQPPKFIDFDRIDK